MSREKEVWFIADTHFAHKAIVQYCGRPFDDIGAMDQHIIENWNNVVKPDDTVYHCGDFSLYLTHLEKKQYLDRLNGKKFLVIGNHDIDRVGHWAKLGVTAFKKPIEFEGMILSHEPVNYPDKPNVHGHTHGNIHRGEISEHGIHVCVSVEVVEYTPVSLRWVKEQIKRKEKE